MPCSLSFDFLVLSPLQTVDTYGAVLIGITGGWLYLAASKLLVRLRIDDAVDAVPVHMVGGAWGVISNGLFAKQQLITNLFGRTNHQGWCK
jgi:ammonium transporter, Amt family